MRLIVVGASRLGVALVKRLLDCQHDVVLIDHDRKRLDEVSDRLDCGFIEGDGTLPQVLRDAYADRADALLLMTNHDDVNILGAVVGRSIGYERVILQIVRSELMEVCEELGFDDVITPHATVARSIVRSLEHRSKVWSQLDIAEGLHFASYRLDSRFSDQRLDAVELPTCARVVARLRDDTAPAVAPDTMLREGDRLMVAAAEDARATLDSFFQAEDEGE